MLRLAGSLGLAQVGFHAWIATLPVAMASVGRPDAEIGAVVGSAAVFNLVAALGAGGLIDRFGGRAVYLGGTLFLVAGAVPFALGLVDASSSFAQLVALRMLQGVGLAAVLPAVMTLVPGQVSRASLPTAVAVVGVAGSISLAFTPAVSLVLLEGGGLAAVGVLVCASVAAGAALMWTIRDVEHDALQKAPTSVRPAWRPTWAAPLVTIVLYMTHWGVVTAYLPQRAIHAGADIGLFFMADALGLLVLRVPAGWLAGRVGSRPLLMAGLGVTAVALVLLFGSVTTPMLIVAGLLTGAGSALIVPVVQLELALRSDAHDRGSAFALFTVAFGAGISLGSLAVAPVYDTIGFEGALAGGLVAVVIASLVTLSDRGWSRPGSSTGRPGQRVQAAEPSPRPLEP